MWNLKKRRKKEIEKQTNKKLIDTENRLVVARGWSVGEMMEGPQKVKAS